MNTKNLSFAVFLLLVLVGDAFSQNFWQQTNGPYSSRTKCLYYKKSGGMLFAGTNLGGGIYRSSDNGTSWQKTSVGLEGIQLRQFTEAPDGDIYAAAWNPTGGTPPNLLGVYRSTNNGASWFLTALDSFSITALGVNSSGEVFAAVDYPARLWRTTDNGVSWSLISSLQPMVINDIAVNSAGTIFCAGYNSIVRSTDNGITWQDIDGAGVIGSSGGMAIDSTGHIYVNSQFGIYKSPGDANWVRIMDSISLSRISVSPKGDIYIGRAGGRIMRSTNAGTDWTTLYRPIATTLSSSSISAFAFDLSGNVFAGMDYLGVIRSTNGGFEWIRINQGITNGYISAIASGPAGKIYAGTWNDGLFISSDRGNSWSLSILPSLYVNSISFDNQGSVLVTGYDSTGYSVFYRSTDNGVNWTKVTNNFPQNNCYKIVSSPSGVLFAGVNTGVYISSDNGITWIHSTPNPYMYARDILITQEGNIWACMDQGLLHTTNNGIDWIKMDTLVLQGNQYSIKQLPGGIMLLTTFQNIYRSVNGGTNWSQINSNTHLGNVIMAQDGAIYGSGINLGYSSSAYRSTDGGFNWAQIVSGLLVPNVSNIALDPSGYLYVGTSGSSVFRSTGSLLSVSNPGTNIPPRFYLLQNYPNPFNPSTTIKFEIPVKRETSNVRLVIYDVLGREVATLINQQMKSGSYSVDWDASNYPSGVYFYKLEAGQYRQTKKMVLIK